MNTPTFTEVKKQSNKESLVIPNEVPVEAMSKLTAKKITLVLS